MTPKKRALTVIHGASTAAAAIGGGLAQIPGSDAVPLTSLQAAMIADIAQAHGVSLTETSAATLVARFAAVKGGRLASQLLFGWIPGAGNAVNAATAAAATEAIGWSA